MNVRTLPEIELITTGGPVLVYVDGDVEPEKIPGRSGVGVSVRVRDVYYSDGTAIDEEMFDEFENEIIRKYLGEVLPGR